MNKSDEEESEKVKSTHAEVKGVEAQGIPPSPSVLKKILIKKEKEADVVKDCCDFEKAGAFGKKVVGIERDEVHQRLEEKKIKDDNSNIKLTEQMRLLKISTEIPTGNHASLRVQTADPRTVVVVFG